VTPDAALQEVWPLAARRSSTLSSIRLRLIEVRPEGNSPKSDLPVDGIPRRGRERMTELPDMSCACRERLLVFAHATKVLSEMPVPINGISAEERFGDENSDENGENGNEPKIGPAKWRGAH